MTLALGLELRVPDGAGSTRLAKAARVFTRAGSGSCEVGCMYTYSFYSYIYMFWTSKAIYCAFITECVSRYFCYRFNHRRPSVTKIKMIFQDSGKSSLSDSSHVCLRDDLPTRGGGSPNPAGASPSRPQGAPARREVPWNFGALLPGPALQGTPNCSSPPGGGPRWPRSRPSPENFCTAQ